MRHSATAVPLLALSFLARPAPGVLLDPTPSAPDAAGDFAWRNDLEASRKAAWDQGKPLLVVFR